MKNIKYYRDKALAAAINKINNVGEQQLQIWDYQLDTLARKILGLPERPKNDLPYIGWISKPNSNTSNDKNTKKSVPSIQISQKGISLIKRWEGFRDKAYLCPANVWTIGYGHTNTAVPGKCISRYEAETLLKDDLRRFEKNVYLSVHVPLSQGNYDALVSFSFNVGITAFNKSTLLRELNRGNYLGASEQFSRWVFANGKKLPGLIKRRQDEKMMFLS